VSGWTITVSEEEVGAGYGAGLPGSRFRLIAVDADRQRVIHRKGLTSDQVDAFDPDREWAVTMTNRRQR
jgi:hypothetical protein